MIDQQSFTSFLSSFTGRVMSRLEAVPTGGGIGIIVGAIIAVVLIILVVIITIIIIIILVR